MKDFLLTILSEAKRPQTQCLSPNSEFWVCSEVNSRMVQNSFQRPKGNPGNRPHSMEAKKQRSHLPEYFFLIKSSNYKICLLKLRELRIWGFILSGMSICKFIDSHHGWRVLMIGAKLLRQWDGFISFPLEELVKRLGLSSLRRQNDTVELLLPRSRWIKEIE